MRMVLIALIALLAIGGGGAGAYFYFMKPAQASAGEDVKKAAEVAKKAEDHSNIEYVKLDPLILPVIDGDGLTQVVSLVIAIEVEDKANMETVEKLVPRLTDAFIQDMYGSLGKKAMKDGIIQINLIKARLNKISEKVLGGDIKNNVLLQVVQQRPA